jgi:vibriolysin
VALTATPDPGSLFAGWSGDCSGTGSCQVTMSQARSVTATFAPNSPPRASFTLTCTRLLCEFDASSSTDATDPTPSYAWSFGDSTIGSGSPTLHSYPKAGRYTVTLTVTDNAGASAVTSTSFNPISVSVRGYRANGRENVELSWAGQSGANFDIYRNGSKLTSVAAMSYTDKLNLNGSGSYAYKVCQAGASLCSNTASVTF